MSKLILEKSFTVKTRKFGLVRVYVSEFSTLFRVTVRPCNYYFPILVDVPLRKKFGIDCLKAAELILNREMIM